MREVVRCFICLTNNDKNQNLFFGKENESTFLRDLTSAALASFSHVTILLSKAAQQSRSELQLDCAKANVCLTFSLRLYFPVIFIPYDTRRAAFHEFLRREQTAADDGFVSTVDSHKELNLLGAWFDRTAQ